ncbi:MAG: aspartate aminotransferase family protein [Spirochaetaceae bacterium]
MSATTGDLPFPKNYASELLALERGAGVYVEDTDGTRYLDLGAGIAVNALGYGRHDLAEIAQEQMRKLIHVSNLYTTRPALELGRALVGSTPSTQGKRFAAVHFGNSGAEANESALKYARLYAGATKGPGHHRFLTFSNGFHGRTMGSLSVTANAKYRTKFEPLVPGVEVAPFNDPDALEKTLDESFAGVIVEVVQGEGGLRVMTREFARALNELTAEYDVMLIGDEIQTGLGRTGFLYGSTAVGLEPDIVSLSKPLAGGLPLSATLIPAKVNDILQVGDHGSTFGGGPVTTAVARRVWDIVSDLEFLARVRVAAEHLERGLAHIVERFGFITGTRGLGMLRGLEVAAPEDRTAEIMSRILAAARENGLLILKSGGNIIRIAPPLVITADEIDRGLGLLEVTLSHIAEEFKGDLA